MDITIGGGTDLTTIGAITDGTTMILSGTRLIIIHLITIMVVSIQTGIIILTDIIITITLITTTGIMEIIITAGVVFHIVQADAAAMLQIITPA